MKYIFAIIICLVIVGTSGCADYQVKRLKKQMLEDRLIMIRNPVHTNHHGAARQRYNRDLQELVRLGYFQREVIPLRNIKQNSPNAESLWTELREGMDLTNDLGEATWSPGDKYEPERFTLWDTPERIETLKTIIKKHDEPEMTSGQQGRSTVPTGALR